MIKLNNKENIEDFINILSNELDIVNTSCYDISEIIKNCNVLIQEATYLHNLCYSSRYNEILDDLYSYAKQTIDISNVIENKTKEVSNYKIDHENIDEDLIKETAKETDIKEKIDIVSESIDAINQWSIVHFNLIETLYGCDIDPKMQNAIQETCFKNLNIIKSILLYYDKLKSLNRIIG